jgi:ribosomal protein L37AE/L43A
MYTINKKNVKITEDNKYYIIRSHETEICPFCDNNHIVSGSWTPSTCTQCNASFYMGAWYLEINDQNEIDIIDDNIKSKLLRLLGGVYK